MASPGSAAQQSSRTITSSNITFSWVRRFCQLCNPEKTEPAARNRMSEGAMARKAVIEPHIAEKFIESGMQYNVDDFLQGKYWRKEDEPNRKGGQGVVFRIQAKEGKTFALKVPKFENITTEMHEGKPNKDELISVISRRCRRLEQEALILKKAANVPNVVRLIEDFDTKVDLGPPFVGLVLELMDGDLEDLCKKGFATPEVIFSFFKQGVDVLCELEKLDIIHGDIKPANFLYRGNPDNDGEYIFKIADFGFAKFESPTNHARGGTYSFLAPEAVSWSAGGGQVCCESDLWSLLACVAWAFNIEDSRRKLSGKHEGDSAKEDHKRILSHLRAVVRKFSNPSLAAWRDIFEPVNKRPDAEEIRERLQQHSGFHPNLSLVKGYKH